MRKVLFVTNHYLDQNFGGPNASKGFIHAFASIYKDMTLIYPDYGDSKCSDYIPSSVRRIPCFDNRSKFRKILDVYLGRVTRYYRFIAEHLSNNQYDLIIIDHSKIWANNTKCFISSNSKIITIHHNVEKYYLKDNPINCLVRIQYNRYSLLAEKNAINNSDINLTLTLNDKETLKSIYPNSKGSFYYLGAFEHKPISFTNPGIANKRSFIITGNLSFKQTSAPIYDFLRFYLPVLETIIPDVRVIIAGRNPSKNIIEECQKYHCVELVANPKDMAPLLKRASVYICPTDKGSGQKLRISDGLKSGLPVICHRNSLSGYEMMLDQEFLIPYDSVESFKNAVIKVFNKMPDKYAVYSAYEAFFSLEAGIARLNGILSSENLI